MPIKYTCSCGKVLQIKDELVGKKLKCPGCQTVFLATALGAKGAAGAKPTAPSAPAKPKEAIKPAAKSAPTPKRPAPKPAAEGDEFFSDMGEAPPKKPVRSKAPPPEDEDEDETPVKGKGKAAARGGKKGSKKLLLVLAAVLVLAGGYAGAAFFLNLPPFEAKTPTKGGPIAKKNTEPPPPDGQQPPTPSGVEDDLALVPGDTLAFVSLHKNVLKASLVTQMRKQFAKEEQELSKDKGFSLDEVERISFFLVGSAEEIMASQEPPLLGLIKTSKAVDQKKVVASLQATKKGRPVPDVTVHFVNEQLFLVGQPATVKKFLGRKEASPATGLLQRALTLAGQGKTLVAAGVFPPALTDVYKKDLENSPNTPPFVKPFLQTKEALLTLDLTDSLALNLTLGMADAKAAAEAQKGGQFLVDMGKNILPTFGKDPTMGPFVAMGEKALGNLSIAAKDSEVTVSFQAEGSMVAMVPALLLPAMLKVRGSASDAQEMNNLKQIALAFLNYHDVNKTFPPQNFRGGLSWRVAILPYIEQGALYNAFKLDEPWDSEHNIKLLGKMPSIYAPISGKGPPLETFYQVFVGPKTLNADPKKGKGLAQIIDGSSNTLLVAESAKSVPWTKPEDIEVKAEDLPMLGATPQGFFLAALADGSVRKFPQKLDPQLLRNLIDPADANPIDWKQIDPSRPGPSPFPSKEFQKKVDKGLLPKEQPEEVNPTEKKEAEPKVVATKPGLPRVSKITRARAAELGDGKQLTPTNPAVDVVVVVKIENLPAKFESFTLFREGAFFAGGQKRNFNSLTAPAAGSYIWAAGIIPASARKMTINLGRNISPLSVDLPPTIDDRSKVGE